jgi:ABC transport system ATP-binding/permease protein
VRPARVAEAPRTKSEPARPRVTEASRPTVATMAASNPQLIAAPSGGPSPLDTAQACLGRGDNECVIHALEGQANTSQELGLLIETYRATGDAQKAQRNMATYVKRFPNAARADTYRRMLDLQSQ